MISFYLQKLRENIVLKNILLLFTGTGIAQIVPVIVSFALARLYTQNDYGDLSIFMSITGIVGVIAALRYELVIILPRKENEARNILFFSMFLSLLVGISIFLIILFFPRVIKHFIDITDYKILFLAPLVIIFTGVYNSLYNWFNRKRLYKIMIAGAIILSLVTSILRLLLGLWGVSMGLIWGIVIGYFAVVVLFLFLYIRKESLSNLYKSVSYSKMRKLFLLYKDFAKYSVPGAAFNSISNIGLPLLISYFYSIEVAGIYFFANNLITMPIALLSASISQVYKKEANEYFLNCRNELFGFTVKMQKLIVFFVLPILILLGLFGGDIFSVLFGERWKEAGDIIPYFSIFILCNALYSPISSIGDILRKQKLLLFFNIILVTIQVVVFYCCKFLEFKTVLFISSTLCAALFVWLDLYMKHQIRKIAAI